MSNETRKVPTRPGWWWREGNRGPYIEEVDCDQNHAPFLAILGSNVVDDGTWLAPIPGPEVLAALAEYSAAFMARDDDARAGGSYANGEVRRERIAADALHAAIRAERDGAA